MKPFSFSRHLHNSKYSLIDIMIKFHRPQMLIAPPETPPAERTVIQKLFHKKKDDSLIAERRTMEIYAGQAGQARRTKLLGGLVTIKHKKPDMQALTTFTVGRLRELAGHMRILDEQQPEKDRANEEKRFADIAEQVIAEKSFREMNGLSEEGNLSEEYDVNEEYDVHSEEEIQKAGQSDHEGSVAESQSSSQQRGRARPNTPLQNLAQKTSDYMRLAAKEFEDTPTLTGSSIFTRTEQEASIRKAVISEEAKKDRYGEGWQAVLDEQNQKRNDVANQIVDLFSAASTKGIDLSKVLESEEIVYLTRAMGYAKEPASLQVPADDKVAKNDEGKATRNGTYHGSFVALKNIAHQTAELLHATQVQKLLDRLNGAAKKLDESLTNLQTQHPVAASSLLDKVEEIILTLSHIDDEELSRLCNHPGEAGDLAEGRMLGSLSLIEARIAELRNATQGALRSQMNGGLSAQDKSTLKYATRMMGRVKDYVRSLQNKIGFSVEDNAASEISLIRTDSGISFGIPPDRQADSPHSSGSAALSDAQEPEHDDDLFEIPLDRQPDASHSNSSTTPSDTPAPQHDNTPRRRTLADFLGMETPPPKTPQPKDDNSISLAEAINDSPGWPLRTMTGLNANPGREQVTFSSRPGKEIVIEAETHSTSTVLPFHSTGDASSSKPSLANEYRLPLTTIPSRLQNAFATSSEPIAPRGARPLNEQELSVVDAWARRVGKSLFGSAHREFMAEKKELLEAMAQDGQLRTSCINSMHDGLTDCTDRALVMWQQVRTQKYARDAELGKYDLNDVYDMGIRMHRMAKVDEYAFQSIQNITDNKRLKSYGKKESTEVVLHARESLQSLLNLPIPKTNGTWNSDAARIPGMYSNELIAHGRSMLRSELASGADNATQLVHFLASWPPLTQQLGRLSPELTQLHKAIDMRGNALLDAIEEHNNAHEKWQNLPALNSQTYNERSKQCATETSDLHFEANLAAVKTFMYGHKEADAGQKLALETDLEKVSAISTPAMAARFLPALKEAVQSKKIDPSWVHPINRWNMLHVAAVAGDPQLVTDLKNIGVNMHQTDNKGMLPLHLAASAGADGATIHALSDQQNIHTMDKTGYSPLHWTAYSGSLNTLGALFQKNNIDVNARNAISGKTPLHIAVTLGKFGMARALIGAGADPQIKDNDGKTAKDLLKKVSAKDDPEGYQLTKKALEMGRKMVQHRTSPSNA